MKELVESLGNDLTIFRPYMLPVSSPENVPFHDPAMVGHSNDFIPTQIFKDGNFSQSQIQEKPGGN